MSTAFPQVDLSQNAGRVVVSDVHAGTLVQPGAPGVASGPTARITDSAAVLLDGCRLRGLNPAYIAAVSGGAQSGLRVTGSRVWIADTRVQGAEGGYSNTCGSSGTSGPGATALVATASTLVLARSTVIGGDGGAHDDCFEPNFGVGFDGGDGIALLASELLLAGGPGNSVVGGTTTWWHPCFGPNPTVGAGVLVDGTSRARAATDAVVVSGGGFVGTVGPDGAFEVLAGGVLVQQAYPQPTADVLPTLAAPGESVALSVSGTSGAVHLAFWSPTLGPPTALPGFGESLALPLAEMSPLAVVAIAADGLGSFVAAVPSSPSLAGATLVAQTVEVGPNGLLLSNPTTLAIR